MLFFEDLMKAGAAIKVNPVRVEKFLEVNDLRIGGFCLQKRDITELLLVLIVFSSSNFDIYVIDVHNYFSCKLADLSFFDGQVCCGHLELPCR